MKPVKEIIAGKLGSAYGVLGWIKMFSLTEKTDNIFNYQPWFIKSKENKWQLLELENWKYSNKKLIIKINNIETREAAKLLTNKLIIIDVLQLADLNKNEYYWKDLLLCHVFTISGYLLGEVVDLMETSFNDILVVKSKQKDFFGIQERLIPFINEKIIKSVNLTNHTIKVDWNPNF